MYDTFLLTNCCPQDANLNSGDRNLNGKPKGIGFIRKNTDTTKRNDLYVNTISEVERITGMTFFPSLPNDIADSIKSQANLKDWDPDLFKRR